MRREGFTLNLFRALYCAQGTADRFVWSLILAQMYTGEIDYKTGALGFCFHYLPWIVKPLLGGPLVDGLKARRETILIAANATMAASIAIFPLFSQTGSAIIWLALLNGMLSALQDVATDGIAFEYFPGSKSEHRVEKAMQQGAVVGNLVGGAGMLALMPILSWSQVCGLMAAWIAANGVLPAAALGTYEAQSVHVAKDAPYVAEIRKALHSKAFLMGCAIAVCSFVGSGFLDAGVYGKWLATQKPDGTAQEVKDAARVALAMLLIVADLARLVGAPFAEFLAKRASGKQISNLFVVIPLAVSYMAFGWAANYWHLPIVMAALVAVSTVFESVWRVHCHALLRSLTSSEAQATEFAIFMSLRNLSKFWAGLIAAAMVTKTPVTTLFLQAGILQLLVLVPLAIYRQFWTASWSAKSEEGPPSS